MLKAQAKPNETQGVHDVAQQKLCPNKSKLIFQVLFDSLDQTLNTRRIFFPFAPRRL